MDNKKVKDKDETLIDNLENVQKEFPNLVLPNMGIIDNERRIEINSKDYIKPKIIKED